MAFRLGLFQPHPNSIGSHFAPKSGVIPGTGTIFPPRQERKRQDDFRLSCFVRTADRVSLSEARDSSNFPREVYHIWGEERRIYMSFLTLTIWALLFERLAPLSVTGRSGAFFTSYFVVCIVENPHKPSVCSGSSFFRRFTRRKTRTGRRLVSDSKKRAPFGLTPNPRNIRFSDIGWSTFRYAGPFS